MPRPTDIGVRHEILALAHEGMSQGYIELTHQTVNRILRRQAMTGSLQSGKSSGAPCKMTLRQERALLRMVRQDRLCQLEH